MNLPQVVPPAEWESARAALLVKEKEATRARDALALERRRLPMVRMEKQLRLRGSRRHGEPAGAVRRSPPAHRLPPHAPGGRRRPLLGLLDVRRQHRPPGPPACPRHLPGPGVAGALGGDRGVQEAHGVDDPLVLLGRHQLRCRPRRPDRLRAQCPAPRRRRGLPHLLHVRRGVEALGSTWTFLDLTPLGRQEDWEDSPEGWPQTRPYEWWRLHDEYHT